MTQDGRAMDILGQPLAQLVTCSACQQRYAVRERDIIWRPVADEAGIFEVGLKCPKCRAFRRAAFDSQAFMRARADIQSARGWLREILIDRYRRDYARLQKRMIQQEALKEA